LHIKIKIDSAKQYIRERRLIYASGGHSLIDFHLVLQLNDTTMLEKKYDAQGFLSSKVQICPENV